MDILPSDTIRFDIPVHETRQDATLNTLGGLEPTHCLAVRPRTRSNEQTSKNEMAFGSTLQSKAEEVGRMIPIQ